MLGIKSISSLSTNQLRRLLPKTANKRDNIFKIGQLAIGGKVENSSKFRFSHLRFMCTTSKESDENEKKEKETETISAASPSATSPSLSPPTSSSSTPSTTSNIPDEFFNEDDESANEFQDIMNTLSVHGGLENITNLKVCHPLYYYHS